MLGFSKWEENVVKKIIKNHIQELNDFIVDDVKVYQKDRSDNYQNLIQQEDESNFDDIDLCSMHDNINFDAACEIDDSELKRNSLEKEKRKEAKIKTEDVSGENKDVSFKLTDMSLF